MKIAVAGTGYVGLSLSLLLSQHHDVVVTDIKKERVDLINLKKSPIIDKDIEDYLKNNNRLIEDNKKLKEYIDQFRQTLVEKLKREEFPDFLVSKYIQLIKNKFLTLLSEKNIDVSYFYFSDTIITFIDIYQDIFINKKQCLFNAKNKNESLFNYFILIFNIILYR